MSRYFEVFEYVTNIGLYIETRLPKKKKVSTSMACKKKSGIFFFRHFPQRFPKTPTTKGKWPGGVPRKVLSPYVFILDDLYIYDAGQSDFILLINL